MANSQELCIKLCGVIEMFGVDSFSHKVYRIVDLWLILVFFLKKATFIEFLGSHLSLSKNPSSTYWGVQVSRQN